jgi:hypothetical protein
MNLFGDLPTWAITILALLAAAVLIALNIGWLLSAKAMLDARRRKARDEGRGARDETRT